MDGGLKSNVELSDWFGVVFTWFEGGLCSPSNPDQPGKK
jgi:hypothetical protein